MLRYKREILLKGLVTFKRIVFFTGIPVFFPSFARIVLFALPAELDPLFLNGTCNKRATDGHSARTLASRTSALCVGIIHRAESTGEPADANIRILDAH